MPDGMYIKLFITKAGSLFGYQRHQEQRNKHDGDVESVDDLVISEELIKLVLDITAV